MSDEFIHSFWLASALVLVLEGIMPFLNPAAFRRALFQMAEMKNRQLRMIGLFSMALGLVILYWVNN